MTRPRSAVIWQNRHLPGLCCWLSAAGSIPPFFFIFWSRPGWPCVSPVVHVDHQLQDRSGDWSRFCQRLVDQYGVPFALAQVAVDGHAEGLEAGARDARYGVLLPMARGRRRWSLLIIVMIRQRPCCSDCCEEPGCRASLPCGASGREGVPLWRPLLAIGRPTLESWAGRERHSLAGGSQQW